jgi:hypothetical protein
VRASIWAASIQGALPALSGFFKPKRLGVVLQGVLTTQRHAPPIVVKFGQVLFMIHGA